MLKVRTPRWPSGRQFARRLSDPSRVDVRSCHQDGASVAWFLDPIQCGSISAAAAASQRTWGVSVSQGVQAVTLDSSVKPTHSVLNLNVT